MAESLVSDELWQKFHDLVNMESSDLRNWVNTQGAGEQTESLPDQAGPQSGRRVIDILAKRRTDLTRQDIDVMRHVVDFIGELRGYELDPTAGDDQWRHRLMDVGHDPLRPSGRGSPTI